MMRTLFFFILLVSIVLHGHAQRRITLEEALEKVTAEHPSVKSLVAEQEQQEALKRASFDLPKTNVSLMKGQYNSIAKNDNNITISQSIPFPTVFARQRQVASATVKASGFRTEVTRNDLAFQVKTLYQNLLYHETLNNLYAQNDSLFATLVNAVQVRYRTGEGTLLEKTAVETQYMEIQNQQKQNAVTIRSLQAQLALMLQSDEPVTIAGTFQRLPEPPSPAVDSNPGLQYWKQQTDVALWQRKLEVSRALPEISLGYFTQTLIGFQTINNQEQYFGPRTRFTGYMVGLSIPLWFGAHTARIKAASYNRQVFEYQEQAYRNSLLRETEDVLQNLQRSKSNLEYYEQKALPNADLLEKQSILAFRGGDIDYTTFLLNVRQALAIREHHLLALSEFNLQIISLEHLIGTR